MDVFYYNKGRNCLQKKLNFNKNCKTENGLTLTTVVIEAAKHVIDGKVTSIRATAKKFRIHYLTLSRYINKVKKAVDMGMPLPMPGYKKLRQVFTF